MTKALTPIIGITVLIQVLIFLIGLTNNVILSRWLGPEVLGALAIIIVLIEILYKTVNPGLDTATLFFISNKRFPFSKLIGNYLFNGLLIFVISILLLAVISETKIISVLFETINADLIAENFGGMVLYLFTYQFYEFGIKIPLGLQQFKRYNKIQILKPVILFIFLIICSMVLQVQLWLVLVVISFSFMIPTILLWRNAFPIKIQWNKEITSQSVSYGYKVMVGNLLTFLTYRSDIILIGLFLSQTAVGWYYVSVLIAEKLLLLTQATGTIFFPAASSSGEHRQKTPILTRTNLFFVLIGSVIIGGAAPWIVPLLFSTDYSNSVMPVIVLLPGIAALTVSKILSADFGARGLPKYSMYISFTNFFLNIILNLILIPKIGIVGAALSSSISYTAGTILQFYFYKKITGIQLREIILIHRDDLKSLRKI